MPTRVEQSALRQILSGKTSADQTFSQNVWAVTARIPKGSVATYSQVAKALTCRSYRAVGTALHRNPYAPQVPCHRVVGSDGRLVGFAYGLDAKRHLLEQEGIVLQNGRVDLDRYGCEL